MSSSSSLANFTLISNDNAFIYYLHDYWIEVQDPRTRDFPLLKGGIWEILSIMTLYLLLIKKILPQLMQNRKPFQLRAVIRVYNTCMVAVNAYFFYEIACGCNYGRRFLEFNYPNRNDHSPQTMRELSLAWWGWMSRFADMVDTVFFVLRKKTNQITFLHVYHHTAVPFLGWFSLKVNPLAPIIGLFALFNTAIHVVMYSYYSLASFGPEIQRFLWWKKYITQLQLLQFAVCGIYGVILFCLQTGYPMVWFWVAVGQNPLFFYMFYDFYRNSYQREAAKKLQ